MKDADAGMVIEVWEEFIDGHSIGFVGHYAPLDLHSQGATVEEAVQATREAIVAWVSVATPRMIVRRGPDRGYRQGVHILPATRLQ